MYTRRRFLRSAGLGLMGAAAAGSLSSGLRWAEAQSAAAQISGSLTAWDWSDAPDAYGEAQQTAFYTRYFPKLALPPAIPGIVATAIYTFILSWDEYLYALTMISSADMRTLPLGLFSYFSEGVPDWSGLTATAIAMSIPVVIVFLALQRYFITALTKGALKY